MATKFADFDEASPAMRFGFAERETFAQFLDARMAEHKRMQHDLEAQWSHEIIDEIQSLPKRKIRSGDLFSMLPDELHQVRAAVVRQ